MSPRLLLVRLLCLQARELLQKTIRHEANSGMEDTSLWEVLQARSRCRYGAQRVRLLRDVDLTTRPAAAGAEEEEADGDGADADDAYAHDEDFPGHLVNAGR